MTTTALFTVPGENVSPLPNHAALALPIRAPRRWCLRSHRRRCAREPRRCPSSGRGERVTDTDPARERQVAAQHERTRPQRPACARGDRNGARSDRAHRSSPEASRDTIVMAVLGGEPAVPCTRNPL